MCNTDYRVPRKFIKSQYGGGALTVPGAVGPQGKEPLALLVLEHADPVGWHAVVQKKLLGPAGSKAKEPHALLVLIHADHAGQRTAIHRTTSLWEPELNPAINRNLDSLPMVGTTYLECPAVYLDSRPMEGKVRSKKLEWKPMKISAINRNLDSQPMVGSTYLERPAPAVYLDSWPKEAKVRSKKIGWKPVIIPPDSYTLDSRPMVGTTYLERPAPAVYLDSRPMVGKARSKKLEWKPIKISAINRSLDSQPMVGTTYLERPAPAVYLDSWPMEVKVGSKKIGWKPVIIPPDSYTLDSRTMVGTTYLERPAPVVYLDSWLMKGASYPQPHVDWEVLSSKPALNNVAIVKMVDTDASDDVNTHLPENVTSMSTPMTAPAWQCVDSPRSSTVIHDIVNRMKDSRVMIMTMPENAPPTIDPIVTPKNMPENLTPVSTPMKAPAWPCADSPRSSTVKHDIVNRMKDSRVMIMTTPENAPPTIDPIVTPKNMTEKLTPVSTPMTSLAWPCVYSPRLPTVEHDIVNRRKDSREMEMTMPESAPPTIDPNVTIKNMPENLTSVSTPMTSLACPCVDSPQLPTVKHEVVNRMKDSREVRITSPGNAPPTIDLNVSMKYWEDIICHPLIYVGDFPHKVLKTTSLQP